MRRQIQNANHVGALVLNSNMATVPVEMRGKIDYMFIFSMLYLLKCEMLILFAYIYLFNFR